MHEVEESDNGNSRSTICRCNTCDRTFVDRPGFVGRHYSERVILMVLMYIARGMSPADAPRTVNEECDTKVTERTVRRWASDYPRIITVYTDGLKISNVVAVSVDEKHYKTRSKDRRMYKAICLKSRFIIAVHYFGDNLGYDATNFFKTIEWLGKIPLLALNDRLQGFSTEHKNVFKTNLPSTLYIADAALNGIHVNNNNNNNNVHECHNGSVAQFIARVRGFRSDEPEVFALHTTYHNFLRPHLELN